MKIIKNQVIIDFFEKYNRLLYRAKISASDLTFLVHNFAPKEELNELKKIFFAFDKNGDGKISKEEFVTGLSNNNDNLNSLLKDDDNIQGLLDNMDQDNNGYIGFEEFCIALINKEKILTENNLRMAFNVFDRDKSGGINQNELKYILGEYNSNAKEYLWRKMIEQIDLNRDGQISYEEFKKMMMDVIINKNKRSSMEFRSFPSKNYDININGISRAQIGSEYIETHSKENLYCSNNKNNHKKRNKSVFFNKKNEIE